MDDRTEQALLGIIPDGTLGVLATIKRDRRPMVADRRLVLRLPVERL